MATRKKRKKSKKRGKKKGGWGSPRKYAKGAFKKKRKKRKGGPRGGTPVKAVAVARDNKGRLAGFKKMSVSDFKNL